MIKIKAYDMVDKKEERNIQALFFNDDGTLRYVQIGPSLFGPCRFKLELEEVDDEGKA